PAAHRPPAALPAPARPRARRHLRRPQDPQAGLAADRRAQAPRAGAARGSPPRDPRRPGRHGPKPRRRGASPRADRDHGPWVHGHLEGGPPVSTSSSQTSRANGATNERVELARYTISAGERVVYGQRVLGVVRLVDVPADGHGRRYVIERDLTRMAE